jgi:hypothetical protein
VVHPQRFSDHRALSAWYEVDVTKRATVNIGNIGTNPENEGTDPETERIDPDFYATGGNISWDDFLSNELYPLPYAYGDSDSRTYG